MLTGILLFAAGVFLMIMAHELGHFIAAQRFGIKVEEFFVGFGPRLWSVRRGQTEYGLKAFPLGGYVRIAGMNPFQEPPPEDRDRVFTAKPKWQRAVVLVAGSFTHFVLAFLLLASLFALIGIPRARIAEVEPTVNGSPSPASVAGLRPGDEVLAVDGEDVNYDEFLNRIAAAAGRPMEIRVERGGREVTLTATPVLSEIEGERSPRLGISIEAGGRLHEGPIEATGKGVESVGDMVVGSFRAIGQVFGPEGLRRIGQLVLGEAQRTPNDPVGVVGAARVSGQAVQAGQLDVFFYLFAFFNVFVGILNVLPLPPLDGGHLAVLGIEALSGRRVDPRKLTPITAVVAGFLILFTVSLLYLDVVSPIPNPFQ
jgi:membrane-associated protease RseP (regulator of RpoE activity)